MGKTLIRGCFIPMPAVAKRARLALRACVFLVGFLGVLSPASAQPQRPNIIFLLADDLRFDALGCMGNPDVQTPNLDRLAQAGAVFDNTYCTTAICMASRAQIMTGLYEFTTGTNFDHGNMRHTLWQQSYPVLLKQAGYRTGFAGKFGFHVDAADGGKGSHETVRPAFDWWGGWMGQGSYQVAENATAEAWHQEYGDRKEHTTYALGTMGADFVRESAADRQPFCLSISFKAPHSPYHLDARYDPVYAGTAFTRPANYGLEGGEHMPPQAKSGRPAGKGKSWVKDFDGTSRKYHQLVHGMDVAVGLIRKAVQDSGVAENTVFIFTSDNGYFCGSKGLAGKLYAYEEGSRAPLIIFDPRHPSAGRKLRVSALTGNIDMAPTILDLAGLPAPTDIDGKSLLPLLDEPSREVHESLLLIQVWGIRSAQSLGVVTPEWKYVNWFYGSDGFAPAEELYDMKRDRHEMRNAAANPELAGVLAEMRQRYDAWLDTWQRRGVADRGYPKYLKLAARGQTFADMPVDMIEGMGPLSGEKPEKVKKDKKPKTKPENEKRKARKAKHE